MHRRTKSSITRHSINDYEELRSWTCRWPVGAHGGDRSEYAEWANDVDRSANHMAHGASHTLWLIIHSYAPLPSDWLLQEHPRAHSEEK